MRILSRLIFLFALGALAWGQAVITLPGGQVSLGIGPLGQLGAGSLPAYIPESCRARTSALLIGLENYSDEQQEDVRSIAEVIAGKVVEVPSLDDLAGVWATLIPRRNVA